MSALMAQVARLDFDQVYFGLSEPMALEDLPAGARVFGDPACKDAIAALVKAGTLTDVVWIEKGCDLAAGMYCLVPPDDDSKSWRFEPLAPEKQKATAAAPSFEQCLHALITDGAQSPVVKAWVASFEVSMEGRKA